MGEHTPWTAQRKQLTAAALFGASAIAVGLIVVGATIDNTGPSTSLQTPSTTTQPPSPTTGTYVTPSVTYPTTIPGCDVVEPPASGEAYSWIRMGSPNMSYDNPKFPWFSGPKAVAMSEALRAVLPSNVEVEFADPDRELQFGPIEDEPEPPPADSGITFENPELPPELVANLYGWTRATGTLVRGDAAGELTVNVRQADNPPPPCVAGSLIERRTQGDGTVVDIQDTWSEYDGQRTLSRSVDTYSPDGTRVTASVGDVRGSEPDPALRNSGEIPLQIDELVALATAPGLRVTTPAPPGTGLPQADCSVSDDGDGRDLTRDDVRELNDVLDDYWRAHPISGVTLDRPLGSLQLASGSRTALCQTLRVNGVETRFTVIPGQSLPEEVDVHDPAYEAAPQIFATLSDGSVVTVDATTPYASPRPGITVTRPSGTQITVLSEGASPLTRQQLQDLASIPGLDLPR